MRTLYESILDDEDVLINNTKKDSKCPLFSLYHLYCKYKSFIKIPDDDIRETIIAAGFPRAKYLVIVKKDDKFYLYDESIANLTQKPIFEFFVCDYKWLSNDDNTITIFMDLFNKKSVVNKYFGSKKGYDEFCKKMWDWGFAQPNFWRFFQKFHK